MADARDKVPEPKDEDVERARVALWEWKVLVNQVTKHAFLHAADVVLASSTGSSRLQGFGAALLRAAHKTTWDERMVSCAEAAARIEQLCEPPVLK